MQMKKTVKSATNALRSGKHFISGLYKNTTADKDVQYRKDWLQRAEKNVSESFL